jgi:hypothetical protein
MINEKLISINYIKKISIQKENLKLKNYKICKN